MMKITTNSVDETIAAAEEFASQLKIGDTILYTGEMGAGKTHFTKGIAKRFGIERGVSSPTFALVNEYIGTEVSVFHFDLFRITTYDDLYAIGFFDYFDRGGILAVEWSENITNLADYLENVWLVDISKTGENSREITITRKGA
ncbi:MAG: tRNA (adenosine(37)-N6)-threonylcarbamoyltransferase complex ATPase subunit type 1 TsaE [Ruminiclostridium sp.]|nr:tRNA (adenosine(37)-N6)-threonylcarbamoyltransferase complex ATPase subunit type 1 TsaE [Ruminiclostridium sp.]